jgi:hypothetical protein
MNIRCCGRYQYDGDQDVEIIIETNAVMDDYNYAECDLESGEESVKSGIRKKEGEVVLVADMCQVCICIYIFIYIYISIYIYIYIYAYAYIYICM